MYYLLLVLINLVVIFTHLIIIEIIGCEHNCVQKDLLKIEEEVINEDDFNYEVVYLEVDIVVSNVIENILVYVTIGVIIYVVELTVSIVVIDNNRGRKKLIEI